MKDGVKSLRRTPQYTYWTIASFCSVLLLFLLSLDFFNTPRIFLRLSPFQSKHPHHHVTQADTLETCAWETLQSHVSLLAVPPIHRSAFLTRQSILADAIHAADVDAFIAEPSASSMYYTNISSEFHLSERPFLVIVDKDAHFSYLVPQFETGRINPISQHMVFDGDATSAAIPWREEEDPYAVLKRERKGLKKVMLDENVRHMIASGLLAAGFEVVPMSDQVKRLRSIKTDAEIAILKGINGFTRQLVRALQRCTHVGLAQEDIVVAGRRLFARAGVGKGYWSIALFGSQAAYPHGGKSGAILGDGEFVLLDIGSVLHGYGSDVTRTFLPPGGMVSDELMSIWKTVHRSQTAGLEKMRPNETCRDADAASRVPVHDMGYAPFYTHRLGHGLGLETHEHPYLSGANAEKLSAGVVVTNEPGIYVTDEQAKSVGMCKGFGIRLEDAILVTDDGGVPLTGGRAKSPWDL